MGPAPGSKAMWDGAPTNEMLSDGSEAFRFLFLLCLLFVITDFLVACGLLFSADNQTLCNHWLHEEHVEDLEHEEHDRQL